MSQQYSLIDRLIISVDESLRTLFSKPIAVRKSPASTISEPALSEMQKQQSAALMRINHTGEVCAQALYYGQAVATKSQRIKNNMLKSAEEETDHLAWCAERLNDLSSHTSYLNPIFYAGAFSIGLLAGAIGDKWSLGFVVETERQVEQHLKEHLLQLPSDDTKSKAILTTMCEDEAHHATVAMGFGAKELPNPIRRIMQLLSMVMTTTTYYL